VSLGAVGQIVKSGWHSIPEHRTGVRIDAFVVMPDHVHGILWIDRSHLHLGDIIGLFKAATTREIHRRVPLIGGPVWQRGFHDRIIRDDRELFAIRQYIKLNPVRWRG
jgi:REP element-mobilizing transposase RayT